MAELRCLSQEKSGQPGYSAAKEKDVHISQILSHMQILAHIIKVSEKCRGQERSLKQGNHGETDHACGYATDTNLHQRVWQRQQILTSQQGERLPSDLDSACSRESVSC